MSDEPQESAHEPTLDWGGMIQATAAGAGGVAGIVLGGPVALGVVVAATAISGLGQLLSSRDVTRLTAKIRDQMNKLRGDLEAVQAEIKQDYVTTDQARLMAGKWWKQVIEEFRDAKLDAARRILVGDYTDGTQAGFHDDELFFGMLERMNEDHLKLLMLLKPQGVYQSMQFSKDFRQHGHQIDELARHLHHLGLITWSKAGFSGLHESDLFVRSPMRPVDTSNPRVIAEAISKAVHQATGPAGGYQLTRTGTAFADRIDPTRLNDPKRWHYEGPSWEEAQAEIKRSRKAMGLDEEE